MQYRSLAQLAWVFVAATVAGCSGDSTPGLETPEQLTLYSIDGRDFEPGEEPKTEGKFRRYPMLGKVEVTDAGKRREIVDALKQGLARSDGKRAACFWPRHAIRTVEKGRTTDYVICFECYQLAVHDGTDRRVKPVTREPEAVFNNLLTEAGVPLAPGIAGKGK